MSLPVVISEAGVETFDAIRNQISLRLGSKVARDFEKNTIKVLELISKSPYMYKECTFNSKIRKGVIKKRSSVFYEIKADKIDILFFWDNRQDPLI